MPVKSADEKINFLNKYKIESSNDYKNIPICYGVGCKEQATVSLTQNQWQQIVGLFAKGRSAKSERSSVAKAISKFEQFTGKQTPTAKDKGRNDQGAGLPGQKDCVDETIDTTRYLFLLQERGLLKHHTVYEPQFRTKVMMIGAHFTAVIGENKSGDLYAVDSWFEDNGGETHVVPLNEWISGWRPPSAR